MNIEQTTNIDHDSGEENESKTDNDENSLTPNQVEMFSIKTKPTKPKRWFECKICNKRISLQHLRSHELKHTGEKTFQ